MKEVDYDPPRCRIVTNVGAFNPVTLAFHEWIDMFKDAAQLRLTVGQRLNYLIKPPGWSHDGSRKTSVDLKRDYVRLNPGEMGRQGLA